MTSFSRTLTGITNQMKLHRILSLTIRVFGMLVLFVALYFIAAFGLSYIPVNSDFTQCEKDSIEIYILTNGVHTDLALPLKNAYKDWSVNVDPACTKSGNVFVNYLSFGWGDKAFYLETPTWEDLKFRTAFNALFFLGSAAIHVTFYYGLQENESCRKICINKESYRKLINYIDSSFDKDSLENYSLIKGISYGDNDLFYDAKGAFNLFFTCNTWTNECLKAADLNACLWTPFAQGIFNQYK